MQLSQNINKDVKNQDVIEETAVVLDLLAFAAGTIANPRTPAVLAQVLALLSYNCAMSWASMLRDEAAAVKGGAL